MEEGVLLLPPSLAHRHNLDDPTVVSDAMETRAGAAPHRIYEGLGPEFWTLGRDRKQTPPDRVRRTGLDCLAPRGSQGVVEIGSRTWYA
jgi:hypothetical protein